MQFVTKHAPYQSKKVYEREREKNGKEKSQIKFSHFVEYKLIQKTHFSSGGPCQNTNGLIYKRREEKQRAKELCHNIK